MKKTAVVLLAVLLYWPSAALAAEPFTEGGHYKKLDAQTLWNPDDGRPEVTFFFWYACGACAMMDTQFAAWAEGMGDNVAIHKLPATDISLWNLHARIFLALDEMGVEKKLHRQIFDLFSKPEAVVRTEDDFTAFCQALGLNAETFIQTFNSPSVDRRVYLLEETVGKYYLEAVPAIVVDGRYMTDLGRVESPGELMELTEFLVEKARAEREAAQK